MPVQTDKRVCTACVIVIALHKTIARNYSRRRVDRRLTNGPRVARNDKSKLQIAAREAKLRVDRQLLPDPRRNTSPSPEVKAILANVEFLLRNLSYHFMHTLFSHDAILRYANAAFVR